MLDLQTWTTTVYEISSAYGKKEKKRKKIGKKPPNQAPVFQLISDLAIHINIVKQLIDGNI